MRGLFITGTDTGVGKTFVTCLIVQALRSQGIRVGAYKPVCTGAQRDATGRLHWDDIDRLSAAMGPDFSTESICPQRFAAPLAPPVAARRESQVVDAGRLRAAAGRWVDLVDILLVEGVGGLLSPIAAGETVADLARDFGIPLIIVSAQRLGTLNHTLLTIECARGRGLEVAGVILNAPFAAADDSAASNAVELRRHTDVPILAQIGYRGAAGLYVDNPLGTIDWCGLSLDFAQGIGPLSNHSGPA